MTSLSEITFGLGIALLLTSTAWWMERRGRKAAEGRLRRSEELRNAGERGAT